MILSQRMQSALDFAIEKHANQLDKAGRPYFGHPLRVALAVIHLGEDYFITAILHDVCEDCNVTFDEIESKWGSTVAKAVKSVTRIVSPVKEPYMSLIERSAWNAIGKEVKLADLRDNMQPDRIASLPTEMQSIINRYKKAYNYLVNFVPYDECRFY